MTTETAREAVARAQADLLEGYADDLLKRKYREDSCKVTALRAGASALRALAAAPKPPAD